MLTKKGMPSLASPSLDAWYYLNISWWCLWESPSLVNIWKLFYWVFTLNYILICHLTFTDRKPLSHISLFQEPFGHETNQGGGVWGSWSNFFWRWRGPTLDAPERIHEVKWLGWYVLPFTVHRWTPGPFVRPVPLPFIRGLCPELKTDYKYPLGFSGMIQGRTDIREETRDVSKAGLEGETSSKLPPVESPVPHRHLICLHDE